MLQFYYEVMLRYAFLSLSFSWSFTFCSRCRFVSRRDFQYVEMDTDSAYMALSDELEKIVRPELREEFWTVYGDWFPKPYCPTHKEDFVRCKMREYDGGKPWEVRPCCEEVKRYDKRTPGLFKVEFRGVGMVALNSKTYYCWGEDGEVKYSSKGLSKKTNSFDADTFKSVLFEQQRVAGTNKGFVKRDGHVYTYEQKRTGLTCFYVKRRVLPDGINTSNLRL